MRLLAGLIISLRKASLRPYCFLWKKYKYIENNRAIGLYNFIPLKNMFELPIENIFSLEKTQYPVMAPPLMKFFEVQITYCYFDYSLTRLIDAVILVNTKFCGK